MRFNQNVIYLVIFFLHITHVVLGKELKPSVLVYGNGIEAFAAAMQSANSNVPTIWVVKNKDLVPEMTTVPLQITANQDLNGGLWSDLLMEIYESKEKTDSLLNTLQADLNPQLVLNALERMIQRKPNLQVVKDMSILDLKEDKKEVRIQLSDRRKLKVRAVVDATADAELLRFFENHMVVNRSDSIAKIENLSQDKQRTIITIGEQENAIYAYTFNDIYAAHINNVFFIASLFKDNKNINAFPIRSNLGQGVGATAAYCAFFKTTTDKIDIRKLQMELITFEARLLPFKDIRIEDSNFHGLQKLFLSGVFPWNNQDGIYLLQDSLPVSTAAVKDVFTTLSSRSQLWYADNKSENFTLEGLSSLIKLISFRGNEIDVEIEKDWKKKLKFTDDYQKDKIINRYEFAVLVDKYINPFVKMVNRNGEILK